MLAYAFFASVLSIAALAVEYTCTNSDGSCHEPTCDLYLALSKIPGAGRGVIAGRNFNYDAVLDSSPSILIKTDDIYSWQLFNYVYSAEDDDFSMALFGPAMMYNHFVPINVEHQWAEADIPRPESIVDAPFTTYTNVEYVTTREVSIGEELFVTYGEDWFDSRNMPVKPTSVPPPAIPLSELQEKGHCLTNIYADTSTIPDIGRGVFTKLAHKAGDVVSISPVLLLPKHSVQKANATSVILNYCVSQEGSDVALFPIGLGGMINHKRGEEANVAIQWYDWGLNISEKVLSLPINKLASAPFAQFDFAYVATRDIEVGEELFLDYGASWEAAWSQYEEEVDAWAEDDTNDDPAPQFRHPIGAPAGLFPESFDTPCIGDGCEIPLLQRRLERDAVLSKKRAEAMENIDAVLERSREYFKEHAEPTKQCGNRVERKLEFLNEE